MYRFEDPAAYQASVAAHSVRTSLPGGLRLSDLSHVTVDSPELWEPLRTPEEQAAWEHLQAMDPREVGRLIARQLRGET